MDVLEELQYCINSCAYIKRNDNLLRFYMCTSVDCENIIIGLYFEVSGISIYNCSFTDLREGFGPIKGPKSKLILLNILNKIWKEKVARR